MRITINVVLRDKTVSVESERDEIRTMQGVFLNFDPRAVIVQTTNDILRAYGLDEI